MKARRPYHSPLREAQTRETRERLLAAVARFFAEEPEAELTLEAIARKAGVERRTLFRHFATREDLLAAFWEWINDRVAPGTLPASLAELIDAPRSTFAHFDEHEGVIRASLHSAAGRAMRMAAVPERRKAFKAALAELSGLGTIDRRRVEAVAHALYSASAWEAMRDYAGVSGVEAGDAAAWALRTLIGALASDERSPERKPNSAAPAARKGK